MDFMFLILLFFFYKFCKGVVYLFQHAEEIRDEGFRQMQEEAAEEEQDNAPTKKRVGDPTGKPRLQVIRDEGSEAFSLDDVDDGNSDPFGLED